MRRLSIEDVLFWVLILMITGIILWKLFGSPSDMAMIISIGTLIVSSEMMLWKNFFKMDKNVSLCFMKVKHDMEKWKGI